MDKIDYIVKIEKKTGKPVLFILSKTDKTRADVLTQINTVNEVDQQYYRRSCRNPDNLREIDDCKKLVAYYSANYDKDMHERKRIRPSQKKESVAS